jgi:hypothetical protein
VSLSPLTSALKNPGESVVFSAVAAGTGPFTYVWKRNGTSIPGQTGKDLVLTNLSSADAGTYSVEATGACNTAVEAATLTINLPPTVSIVTPTNGSVFVFPQAVRILAVANDSDGYVTNVEVFQGATKLGETNTATYQRFWTNVPPGSYQIYARAADNLGLMATSSVVNITVLSNAPFAAGPIQLNRQTGLFEQSVTISNPTPYAFTGIRLWIYGLTAETTVVNASGTSNGVPYILYSSAISAGGSGTLMIKYYIPSRIPPSPTLVPEVLGTDYGAAKLGKVRPAAPLIEYCTRLSNGAFLVQFNSSEGYSYYIQYCGSLNGTWKTAAPVITGTGGSMQWIDDGQPKTESNPAAGPARFYRIVVITK